MISAILIAVNSICPAQSRLRPNLEVFDKEISGELDKILFKPDLRRDIQFIFSVNSRNQSDEETKFLNSIIKKSAERNKIWASLTKGDIISTDSVFNSVYIDIAELKTSYTGFAKNKFLGSKIVRRHVSSLINVAIYGNKYDFIAIDTIAVNYHDRVELDDIENLETEDYKFTRAVPPRVSIYEEIVFPVAVICVSVSAAILFFLIRSK